MLEIDQKLAAEFEEKGRVWLRNAISQSDLVDFENSFLSPSKAGQRLNSSHSLKRALSANSSFMKAIGTLDKIAKPVRAVLFAKSKDANWGVPWHQDRIIVVQGKEEVSGYRNWSEKSGTWHCEPPEDILEEMLFVRVHLDDTDGENGAMQISLGSHTSGIVPSRDAETEAMMHPIEVCEAKRGDVLILKMLTLHSSKPAKVHSGRRVLRIDLSPCELPKPLAWSYLT
jgi:ectoine hydroxylase-related dioxygenase (phytanoyl-CoA dioxygenase family)